MTRQRWCLVVLVVSVMAAGRPVVAVEAGHVDTFSDDGTAGWSEGIGSPNPPARIASGGPAGAGDAYLENISSGGGLSPGGKMVMFNDGPWAGDYVAARVARITADMRNSGGSDLLMRIAFGRGANAQTATWYASAEPYLLPANGSEWHMTVPFEISADALMLVSGSGTLQEVLTDVDMVRILSSVSPAFQGDAIAATLGIDNITAVPKDLLGDVNRDWVVDEQDIDPFVGRLITGFYQVEADMNQDGRVNGLDVAPFVAVMTGGGTTVQQVPEPSTTLLLALGLFVLDAKRRRLGS